MLAFHDYCMTLNTNTIYLMGMIHVGPSWPTMTIFVCFDGQGQDDAHVSHNKICIKNKIMLEVILASFDCNFQQK